jgi:hypothetical protein
VGPRAVLDTVVKRKIPSPHPPVPTGYEAGWWTPMNSNAGICSVKPLSSSSYFKLACIKVAFLRFAVHSQRSCACCRGVQRQFTLVLSTATLRSAHKVRVTQWSLRGNESTSVHGHMSVCEGVFRCIQRL